MITVPKPSKRIIVMISTAFIIVGAIGVNKFWPGGKEQALITPEYSAPDIAIGEIPKNSVDGTAFLQQFATSSAATSTDDTPDTISRNITRTIFANTAYLENSNALDDTSKAALVQNAINQLRNSFVYKQYDENNLSYISNENQDTVRSYGADFAALQLNMIFIMQKNIGKIESDLNVLGQIYQDEADALYKLKVPKDLASTHLKIVNNFSKVAKVFEIIVRQKEDPLQIPIAIGVYQTASAEQSSLMAQMAQFFRANGIIFTSEEAGGYWNAF